MVLLGPKSAAISIIFAMLEIIGGPVARNSETRGAWWFSPISLVSFLLSGGSELGFKHIAGCIAYSEA